MRKFRKKLRLFKNDPFGIKEKYFKWKLEQSIRKGIDIRTKALRVYLYIINDICVPRDKEEQEILKKAISEYDRVIAELEKSIKNERIFAQDESEVKE